MKNCKQCNKQFTIYPEDKEYYQRIGVTEPQYCPNCRLQRRLAWRNERCLYKRKCDVSGEEILSVYSSDKPYKVFRADLWHQDSWEGLDYGQDFDFNRPLSVQFKELQLKVPRPSLAVIDLENCPYVNQIWKSKNCYMCFDMGFSENCLYSSATYHSRDVVDCTMTRESELSYFLIDCFKCFHCFYLQDCEGCHDAYFSYDCKGCSNIAFSSNLRNQKYYLFNKQVSPEEFNEFIRNIKNNIQKYIKDWRENIIQKAIHRINHNTNSENCSGDYLLNSKNCHDCYDAESSEDCRYCIRMDERLYNCYDITCCSIGDYIYEGLSCTGHNLAFTFNSWSPSSDCMYCDMIMSCSDCFACVGLKHKKFCILNRQYSEEQYKSLKQKIIEKMKSDGEFGNFYNINISPFAYNETVAQEYFPLTKEQVLKNGWKWKNAGETSTSHLLSICTKCGKNFKLIPQEIKFYEKNNLPEPHECNFCRYLFRSSLRNPRQLFKNNCSKCKKDIQTTYAPEKKLTIYCEDCYKKTIY
jgi:hypothetical protein